MKGKIAKEIQLKEVEDILLSENRLEITFKEIQGYVPVLKFSFIGDYLSISCVLDKTDDYLSSDKQKVVLIRNNFIYMNETSKYYVEVLKEPFEFCIRDNNHNTFIGSNCAFGEFLSVIFDSDDNVKSLKLNLKASNSFFYGLGERFDSLDQSGKTTDMNVIEQFGVQNENSYMPVPFFITEKNYGIYINSTRYTSFNLPSKESDLLEITCDISDTSKFLEMIVFFGEPRKLIKEYIEMTGIPKLPPKWSFGPWMSSNGWNTQKETLEQIDKMQQLEIPATVIVIEAWSDEASFYIFNDAEYVLKDGDKIFKYEDFKFNPNGKWPDPKQMIDYIHENNVKLVLWQIPVIKGFNEVENKQHFNDEKFVIDKKFCVLNADGTPYRIPDNWFTNSLVFDFTNPEAKKWWFDKRNYLIEELKIDGFKTDGGEFIYDLETCFFNGKKGDEMKNFYPVDYISAYNEFIGGDRITFSRAGFSGSQKYSLYWAGDQFSTFEALRSQITAGLSLNISGNPFWGFDIGGFAGEMPSSELFIRSTQFAAFCPIMQFHSEFRSGFNNDRSPWNVSKNNSDESILTIYRRYANIRMNLLPYIFNEARYIVENCESLMRPLIIDFSEDENVYKIEDEYLFGRSLLIAPIINENCKMRSIYLPEGEWIDFWGGMKFKGKSSIEYLCEVEKIPVFIKNNSVVALNLNHAFEMGGTIGNEIDKYDKLCFIITGHIESPYVFFDNLGNSVIFNEDEYGFHIKKEGNLDKIYIASKEAGFFHKNIFNIKLNQADYTIKEIRCEGSIWEGILN